MSNNQQNPQTENKAVRVVVHGKVQGVWYRAWTVENAGELNLDGWVRNRHDSTVEAVLFGPSGNVDQMLKRMQDGPPLARVERLVVTEDAEDIQTGFHQRSTV